MVFGNQNIEQRSDEDNSCLGDWKVHCVLICSYVRSDHTNQITQDTSRYIVGLCKMARLAVIQMMSN